MLLWRLTYLAIFQYEHPFRQYPTTIPAICSITGRTIITSICGPSLVTVVLVIREQLWLCRSRCTIRNSVQNWLELHLWTENSWFPSVIYTKTHTILANIPRYNVQKKIRPKPVTCWNENELNINVCLKSCCHIAFWPTVYIIKIKKLSIPFPYLTKIQYGQQILWNWQRCGQCRDYAKKTQAAQLLLDWYVWVEIFWIWDVRGQRGLDRECEEPQYLRYGMLEVDF